MTKKNLLPEKTGDMSDWYTTLIRLADLADYGPVKGTMLCLFGVLSDRF